jgi:hypothetical protein
VFSQAQVALSTVRTAATRQHSPDTRANVLPSPLSQICESGERGEILAVCVVKGLTVVSCVTVLEVHESTRLHSREAFALFAQRAGGGPSRKGHFANRLGSFFLDLHPVCCVLVQRAAPPTDTNSSLVVADVTTRW